MIIGKIVGNWNLRGIQPLRTAADVRHMFDTTGIRYSSEVGVVLRHLPQDNLNGLFQLLTAIRDRRNAGFILEKLPPYREIVEQPVDWSKFHENRTILGTFISDFMIRGTNRLRIMVRPTIPSEYPPR
jgi:hypothetical protein